MAHFDTDLVVVGAGIVGLASARELSQRRPDLRICVLERERAVGMHQTGTNSGVAHAGIYYTPNSLKARLCVDGIRRMYAFCDERGITYERCGKLIVALDDSELDRLDELERRGHANGVPGLRRVDAEGLREIEPQATGVAALHSPHTGIVDFAAVARSLAADLADRGGDVRLDNEVLGVRSEDGHVVVRDAGGEIRARRALVCAGFWTDRLAEAAGAPADPRIVGFRGAYLR